MKKLVVGRRFGVEKTKEQQHETKEEQQEAFQKLEDKMMDVCATSKAYVQWFGSGVGPVLKLRRVAY